MSVGFGVRFRMVFLRFYYAFLWFSYGCNRPPRWSVGFGVSFRMVFLWFSYGFVKFRIVIIVPRVGPSASGFVFVRFSYTCPKVL